MGYAYNAAANLNLHNLPQAEKSALRAADLDQNNADPRIHFLLAQIYEAKGDRAGRGSAVKRVLEICQRSGRCCHGEQLSCRTGQTGWQIATRQPFVVILSGVAGSRSEAAMQAKDPYGQNAVKVAAENLPLAREALGSSKLLRPVGVLRLRIRSG